MEDSTSAIVAAAAPAGDQLRKRIYALLERDLSQARVAREGGIAASALSKWLKNQYPGDNVALETKLAAWADVHEARIGARVPEAPQWVSTPTAERIIGALRYAQMMRSIVPIYGAAGVGKTMTAEHYAATNPNVWIATMSPDTSSIWSALEEVALAVGVREISGGAAKVRRDIVQRLTGTRGLLIVDEAQHLSIPALEALRRVFDSAKVGLVLMGNEMVYARLTGGSRGADFARLYSRVGNRVRVKGTEPADIEAIAVAWRVTGSDECKELTRIASAHGGLRFLTYVLQLASKVAAAEGASMELRHIEDARAQLGVEA